MIDLNSAYLSLFLCQPLYTWCLTLLIRDFCIVKPYLSEAEFQDGEPPWQ